MIVALSSCYISPNRKDNMSIPGPSCISNLSSENINFSKIRKTIQVPFQYIEYNSNGTIVIILRSYIMEMSVTQSSYGEMCYKFTTLSRRNGSIILRSTKFTDYLYFEDSRILRVF